jgi:hypothetical protein
MGSALYEYPYIYPEMVNNNATGRSRKDTREKSVARGLGDVLRKFDFQLF